MKFYKLDQRSHSYVEFANANQNIYTGEDVLIWAKDVVRMNNIDVEVGDDIELAIEVLDNCGEYLKEAI